MDDGQPFVLPPHWRRPVAIGFGVVTGLVLLLLFVIYWPIARPLLWAAALAVLVYPAHKRVLRLVGGRANVAAVMTTVAWLAILVVPSILAVNQLVSEARDLWPRVGALLSPDVFQKVVDWIEGSRVRGLVYMLFEVPDDAGATVLRERFKTGVDSLAAFIVQVVRDLTYGAPLALIRTSITVATFFFFVRQGPGWASRLREALPLEPTHAAELLDTTAKTINVVFRGVLLTAATQAVLATIGYTVAGAPVPVVLGFLTLLTSLLPFVGAAAVWLPTAIGLYLSGHVGAAIGLAAWGTLVVSLVDNFLRPILIGRGMHLPMVWLFLAIIGALQTFGFLGLLLGPAALALFLACYRIYLQERRQTLPDADQPVQ